MTNKLKIMSQPCNQCLFTKNRIVSQKRTNQIIKDCIREDGHFECHKGTINGDKIVCRSFWNLYSRDVLSLRLALMFNMFEFVEVEENE
jgi:hypothetical protein